jgi:hypothetical protein
VAGWYLDPTNPRLERYWDGSAWTPETRPTSVLLSNVHAPFGYSPDTPPTAVSTAASAEDEDDEDALTEILELMHELVALQYRANARLDSIKTFMWIFFLVFAVPTIVAMIWLVVIGNEII